MNIKSELEKIYIPSENVVAREIDGEMIIVPLTAGIGNMEDELYSLNETGKAIWKKLDGNESLGNIVSSLSKRIPGGREGDRSRCGGAHYRIA